MSLYPENTKSRVAKIIQNPEVFMGHRDMHLPLIVIKRNKFLQVMFSSWQVETKFWGL